MSDVIDDRPAWYLRPVTGVAVVVLVAVAVGVATWAVIRGNRPQARAGTVYDTGYDVSTAHSTQVLLPWGRLELGTTEPTSRLPHDLAEYEVGTDPEPPDGGHFLGVTWKVDASGIPSAAQSLQVRAGGAPNTLVSLLVGGHTYPLYTPAQARAYCASVCLGSATENRAWVAVTGDTSDVGFAVAYDGVTQTVDARTGAVQKGRAAGLYSTKSSTTPACGAARWQTGFTPRDDDARCSLTVTRTAFVRGLGWAPSGRQWIAVYADLERPAALVHRSGSTTSGRLYPVYASSTRTYAIAGATLVFRRLDGLDAGGLGPSRLSSSADILVFSAPDGPSPVGPLRMSARFPLDNSDGPASAATTYATASWTVSL